MILFVLFAVMAGGCMEGTEIAKSIELGGNNFTLTDADGWFFDFLVMIVGLVFAGLGLGWINWTIGNFRGIRRMGA